MQKNKKSQSPTCTLKRNPSSVTVPLWLLPALPHTPLCTLFSLGPAAFPGIIKMLQWSRAATTKTFSSTTNTVLAATLHSPEDHPPHWSHNFLCLHVQSKTRNYTNYFVGGVFFVKASSFFAAHQHCLSILHNVFFITKKSVSGRKKENFLRRLMCTIFCN